MTRSLADRPGLRLAVLCILYVGQGIPWGFTAVALPTYLATTGASEAAIGSVIAMTTLPYSFKWAWGPLMDTFTLRRFGRRRPWIIGAQGLMAISIGGFLWWNHGTDADALAILVFVNTMFSSVQDVAVDGLAVDLVPESERGRATGFTYGAKYGGGMIGAGGMTWVIAHAGLRSALTMQVVILLAIMIVPIVVRERSGEPDPSPPVREVLAALVRAFSLRSTILCAVLMLVANFANGMMSVASLALYTQHLHWTADDLAPITGVLGPAVGMLGAAGAGVLADRVGHKKLAATGMLMLALGWAGFAVARVWWGTYGLAIAGLGVEQAGQAITSVALMAVCMDVSVPKVGASQFAAYMALMNFSTTLGAHTLAPRLAATSFETRFLLAALFQIPLVVILGLVDTRQARRVFSPDNEPPPGPPTARLVPRRETRDP